MTSIEKAAGRHALTRTWLPKVPRALLTVKRLNDKFLWQSYQPALKLQVAERKLAEMEADPRFDHIPIEQKRADIANMVNKIFGGMLWERFLWANPLNRSIMQSLLFAPDWTMSALQATGIPDFVKKELDINIPILGGITPSTSFGEEQLMRSYWPTFIAMVLFGIPAAVQAAIYAAFGDPDKGDQPWMWNNEAGMQSYVDTTPWDRVFEKLWGRSTQDSTTRSRRSYWRWGKQGWELLGWAQHPGKTLSSKSSVAVKIAIEQLLGKNSAWWDMPWADSDEMGLFSVNGKFTDSRAYALLEKFAPMNVAAYAKNRPWTLFAPAKYGMSQVAAEKQIIPILEQLADKDNLEFLRSKPETLAVLRRGVGDILDAAERNGYDREETFGLSLSKARGRYYLQLWNEINKTSPNEEVIRQTSATLRRLAVTPEMLNMSITKRATEARMKIPAEIKSRLLRLAADPGAREVEENEQQIVR
jgi:hypothetical protein